MGCVFRPRAVLISLRMWGKTYSRPDLYKVLVSAQSFAKTPEEQRLSQVVLSKFRHVGAHLETKQRQELEALDARCSTLCFTAEQNINEDCSSVLLSAEELEGCAETFVQSLPEENGLKQCSLKARMGGPLCNTLPQLFLCSPGRKVFDPRKCVANQCLPKRIGQMQVDTTQISHLFLVWDSRSFTLFELTSSPTSSAFHHRPFKPHLWPRAQGPRAGPVRRLCWFRSSNAVATARRARR